MGVSIFDRRSVLAVANCSRKLDMRVVDVDATWHTVAYLGVLWRIVVYCAVSQCGLTRKLLRCDGIAWRGSRKFSMREMNVVYLC